MRSILLSSIVALGCSGLLVAACSDDSTSSTPAPDAGSTSSTSSSTSSSGGSSSSSSGGSSTSSSSGGTDAGNDAGSDAGTPPSTDPSTPVTLEVGKPFTGPLPAGMATLHFFAFTVPATGTYTFELQGPPPLNFSWCDTSSASGCACVMNPNGVTSCCTVEQATTTCTFTAQNNDKSGLAQGTKIYPLVSWFGAPSGSGTYTAKITGPN